MLEASDRQATKPVVSGASQATGAYLFGALGGLIIIMAGCPGGSSSKVAKHAPAPPWNVVYHDGSGNSFTIQKTRSPGTGVSGKYAPMTPERSSSGEYSGGDPWEGTVSSEQAQELWRRIKALDADTTNRVKSRVKGSGSFRIRSTAGERTLLVGPGETLSELDGFLEQLRK